MSKRKHEEKINFDSKIQELYNKGFTVFPNKVEVTDNVMNYIVKSSSSSSKPIFNHNETSRYNDNKRQQTNLKYNSKYMSDFMENITLHLNEFLPHLKINDWVILHSKPGCKEQALHTDYIPSQQLAVSNKLSLNNLPKNLPINVMLTLQDNTSVIILVYSHNLIQHEIDDKTKNYDNFDIIERKVLIMNKGDLLFFRGDIIHAGAGYTTDNYRLHCYMDSESVERIQWLIEKHGSDYLKKIVYNSEIKIKYK